MKIHTGPQSDVKHPKPEHGAYEWWYFDGMDDRQELSWVLIFYEGNPFSPWYDQRFDTKAEDFPAATISIYHRGEPIYYSFIEYEKADGQFSSKQPNWTLGGHQVHYSKKDGKWIYTLHIDDQLPSGDRLEAHFEYESSSFSETLEDGKAGYSGSNHQWTLVQPCANVKAEIRIWNADQEQERQWKVEGAGYHDHNLGAEPMREEFYDWYWGRIHFPRKTLLYYVMHRSNEEQYQGWIISNDELKVIDRLQSVELSDVSGNGFLLASSRKLELTFSQHQAMIQQRPMIDSGPFYQRFNCSGILQGRGSNPVTAKGISEYIRPGRISNRLFHPLVKMRLYSKREGAHWVQRSPRLYRWTW